jgi:hypothetical protein
MKWSSNRLILPQVIGAFVMIALSPGPAQALRIQIGQIGVGAAIITDNGPGDSRPEVDVIGFEVEIINPLDRQERFIAQGVLKQEGPSLTLTGRITASGTRRVSSIIVCESSEFAPIGSKKSPVGANVHLAGEYSNRINLNISFADVDWTGYANARRIAAINPRHAKDVVRPVPFGPPADPDESKSLQLTVTQLFGHLGFRLNPADRIELSGEGEGDQQKSASVSLGT